jgi:hypothetical protein
MSESKNVMRQFVMELESGSKKENDSLLLEPEAEIDH